MPIFYSDSASFNDMQVTGSTSLSGSENVLTVAGSGSRVFVVSGSKGSLLEVIDIDTNTEVFAVASGSTNLVVVETSKRISLSGSVEITGSLSGQFSIPTASYSITSSYALSTAAAGFPFSGSAQITGSLGVTGSVSVTGSVRANAGFTGSLFGSSSFSTTASFAISSSRAVTSSFAITSSNATTASYAINAAAASSFPYTGSAVITGSLIVTGAFYLDDVRMETSSSIASASVVTVASYATGSYRSGFYTYVISSGSNMRSGQLIGVWTGSTVNYAEVSTTDIGNTATASFAIALSGNNVNLNFSAPGTWTVKTTTNLL